MNSVSQNSKFTEEEVIECESLQHMIYEKSHDGEVYAVWTAKTTSGRYLKIEIFKHHIFLYECLGVDSGEHLLHVSCLDGATIRLDPQFVLEALGRQGYYSGCSDK